MAPGRLDLPFANRLIGPLATLLGFRAAGSASMQVDGATSRRSKRPNLVADAITHRSR